MTRRGSLPGLCSTGMEEEEAASPEAGDEDRDQDQDHDDNGNDESREDQNNDNINDGGIATHTQSLKHRIYHPRYPSSDFLLSYPLTSPEP